MVTSAMEREEDDGGTVRLVIQKTIKKSNPKVSNPSFSNLKGITNNH
jgi:hypothetical protein